MSSEPNISLAGFVSCLIKQADWWTQTLKGEGFHLHFRPIAPKTYPQPRRITPRAQS